MRMSERDLAGAFELLSKAVPKDGQNGAGVFGHEFLDCFRRLIHADWAAYDELDLSDCSEISHVATAEQVAPPEAEDEWVSSDYPLQGRANRANPRALKLSDFYGPRELRQTPAYRLFLRPYGFADELKVYLESPPGEARTFSFERGPRAFGARERTLLELLRMQLSIIRAHFELRALPSEETHERLTPREAEVLGWVARGNTNKQVAAILCVSPHTVRTQLASVFEKLDVHTRTAAVARARAVLSAGGAPRT
jgi:DNA-binding CsgD family transcriptional regulator